MVPLLGGASDGKNVNMSNARTRCYKDYEAVFIQYDDIEEFNDDSVQTIKRLLPTKWNR